MEFTLINLLRKKNMEGMIFRKTQKDTFTEIRSDDKRLINILSNVKSAEMVILLHNLGFSIQSVLILLVHTQEMHFKI